MTKKRSTKWYNKNEKEIMQKFGLIPTPGSGNKWKFKEDGYNDKILCQHKSTDAQSYRIQRDDLDKLEYHAAVEHKVPVFMIQFLEDNKVYLLLEPSNIADIYNYLNIPKNASEMESEPQIIIPDNNNVNNIEVKRKMIKGTDRKSKDRMERMLKLKEQKNKAKFKKCKGEKKCWK